MLVVRRVVGQSMLPAFAPGRLVVAWRSRQVRPGEVVIINHNGREKLKRVHSLRDGHIFLLGDNPEHSTDSRDFGWLPAAAVIARVVWPLRLRRR